jgi:hypothetical protein
MYQSLRVACAGSLAWMQRKLSIRALPIALDPVPVRTLSTDVPWLDCADPSSDPDLITSP